MYENGLRMIHQDNTDIFIVERTLGKLAKWIRILGFNTFFGNETHADHLIKDPKIRKIRLTRIKRLSMNISSYDRVIKITSDQPMEQVKEFIHTNDFTRKDLNLFSRCIKCNLTLQPIHKQAVHGKVPDYIFETHHSFRICNHCQNIFWKGTHFKRTRKIVSDLFKEKKISIKTKDLAGNPKKMSLI